MVMIPLNWKVIFSILLLTSRAAYLYIFNVGNCNETMLASDFVWYSFRCNVTAFGSQAAMQK